ncbi:MAG: dihydroorotate dehydrogenase [Bacilli bacterium]
MRVAVGGLMLQNPVMPASGTFGEEMAQVIDFNALGALVTKSVTPLPRTGNRSPRVAETIAGMLNSVGIQGKGVTAFVRDTVPFYRAFHSPLVVSISADTADEFADLASSATVPGVAALEVNISCPNLEDDGRSYAMDPVQTRRVLEKVRAATRLPLWAKLTPNTGALTEVAQAAEAAGADALVVANTILAMAIDVETKKPKIGNVMGGLSGPAIKPIIVRMVYQTARAVHIPIIGCGGVASGNDALEYLLAGASAVQVGTYNFVQPTAMPTIIAEIKEYAERHGVSRIADLIGAAQQGQRCDG